MGMWNSNLYQIAFVCGASYITWERSSSVIWVPTNTFCCGQVNDKIRDYLSDHKTEVLLIATSVHEHLNIPHIRICTEHITPPQNVKYIFGVIFDYGMNCNKQINSTNLPSITWGTLIRFANIWIKHRLIHAFVIIIWFARLPPSETPSNTYCCSSSSS